MLMVDSQDYKYAVVEVYRIFDVLHFDKQKAYQIEDENGTHKDTVKEGYTVVEFDDFDTLKKQGYTMDGNFFNTEKDAVQWVYDNE